MGKEEERGGGRKEKGEKMRGEEGRVEGRREKGEKMKGEEGRVDGRREKGKRGKLISHRLYPAYQSLQAISLGTCRHGTVSTQTFAFSA